jgi:hypothetical protein
MTTESAEMGFLVTEHTLRRILNIINILENNCK